MIGKLRLAIESLEKRLCLAVTASVTDGGDLLVKGDADGAVLIRALGGGRYEVTDAGNTIGDGTFEGVTDDIRIDLQTAPPEGGSADDQVTVDLTLADGAVDMIYARLGEGTNSFRVTGGSARRVFYQGDDGPDNVTIDTSVDGTVYARLGDGENDLEVLASIGRLRMIGGEDNDHVSIDQTVIVDDSVLVYLGDGNNQVDQAGTVEGRLKVYGRDGDDMVVVAEGAQVSTGVYVGLGAGTNQLSVGGAVDGSVIYHGHDGNDTVELSATADVVGNVKSVLGDGQNGVTVAPLAQVTGDLAVLSKNADDTLDVADGTVEGNVNDMRGEQSEYFHGHHRGFRRFGGFGFRGHGFGGFGFRGFRRH